MLLDQIYNFRRNASAMEQLGVFELKRYLEELNMHVIDIHCSPKVEVGNMSQHCPPTQDSSLYPYLFDITIECEVSKDHLGDCTKIIREASSSCFDRVHHHWSSSEPVEIDHSHLLNRNTNLTVRLWQDTREEVTTIETLCSELEYEIFCRNFDSELEEELDRCRES